MIIFIVYSAKSAKLRPGGTQLNAKDDDINRATQVVDHGSSSFYVNAPGG
jgi:hypothetical protein